MLTIRTPRSEPPTLESIRARYQLTRGDVDETFGVIAVDPDDHAYTVLVDEHAVRKIRSDAEWKVDGPFSNPRIDPS